MAEILFLAHRAPWPPDRGDRIRSWHLLQALKAYAPVHIAAFVDDDADLALAQPVLEQHCASTYLEARSGSKLRAALSTLPRLAPLSLGLFGSHAMQAHVDALLASGRITHIVAFSCQVAQFVPASFTGRFIMDFVDVDSAKFAAYGRADSWLSPMKAIHTYEGCTFAKWEKSVARRADLSLFVSEAEAALFRARSGIDDGRVRALDNGIDLEKFSPDAPIDRINRPTAPLAVFTGQMDYRPNIEAVTLFARDILPRLQQRLPNAGFAIVGRAPTDDVRALGRLPGVTVTGEVPDTRPWLAAADVVVAPLQVARGVQNKLLEAMAMARPVVASPGAATGIDAVAGRDLMIADGAEQTAQTIADLVDDPARALAMGQAARQRMVDRYGWAATMAPLGAMLGLPKA